MAYYSENKNGKKRVKQTADSSFERAVFKFFEPDKTTYENTYHLYGFVYGKNNFFVYVS